MDTLTPEEFAHISRALNEARDTSGILEMVVFAEQEKQPHLTIDIEKLCETYERFDCMHIATLAAFLADHSGEVIFMFGSEQIDLSTLFEGVPSTRLCLYIGNRERGILPLEWLAYLAENIGYLHTKQVRCLDLLCEEFFQEFRKREA